MFSSSSPRYRIFTYLCNREGVQYKFSYFGFQALVIATRPPHCHTSNLPPKTFSTGFNGIRSVYRIPEDLFPHVIQPITDSSAQGCELRVDSHAFDLLTHFFVLHIACT